MPDPPCNVTKWQVVTLSPAQKFQVEAASDAARRRTFKVALEDKSVWVKRPRRGPGYLMYGLQACAATLVQMPPLRPPRVSRGAAGLRAEANRLERLAAKGWPVPLVLDVHDRWLALSDNGRSLATVMRETPVERRLELLRSAIAYLQSLHANGGWHGAAQLRNFTVREEGFGLLDFEDDLEPSMSLPVRQARDVLLFVMSSARYESSDARLVQTLIADARGRAAPAVNAEIGAVIATLVRARPVLGAVARMSGPDGRSLDLIARACEGLPKSDASSARLSVGSANPRQNH